MPERIVALRTSSISENVEWYAFFNFFRAIQLAASEARPVPYPPKPLPPGQRRGLVGTPTATSRASNTAKPESCNDAKCAYCPFFSLLDHRDEKGQQTTQLDREPMRL